MRAERAISLALYIAIVLSFVFEANGRNAFAGAVVGVVPVLLIWFPAEASEYALGVVVKGRTIDAPTPAVLVSGLGWVILVVLFALMVV